MPGLGNLMYNLQQKFGLSVLFQTTGKLTTVKFNSISENMNVWYNAVAYWMTTDFFNNAIIKQLL